ncbi:MAG TPA: LamG-like jellyroll fold domain-containing protein, partial [Myxococcaceae bacterium]|nr:LamG-like jellyroll fold domain-containing protein [Myxococcaceae bacterium]
WMYYGNPGASPPLPADARQVWSNGFAGVWHLAGSAQDSSPQQFDAESTQGTFPAGVHGPGMRFNRTNGDFFRLKNNLRVVSGASSVTFSAWVKPDGAITEKQANIVGVGKSTAGGHASWVSFYLLADGGFGSEAGPDDAGYHVGSTPAGTVPVGSWTHLAAMIDVAGKSMRLFKNGARVGAPQTFDWERAAIPNLPSYATAFGTEEDECCYFYNGFLDELRLERVGRSDAWLGAQYRNLSDPEFTSLGAEEARP